MNGLPAESRKGNQTVLSFYKTCLHGPALIIVNYCYNCCESQACFMVCIRPVPLTWFQLFKVVFSFGEFER